jgi:hypothetical protein
MRVWDYRREKAPHPEEPRSGVSRTMLGIALRRMAAKKLPERIIAYGFSGGDDRGLMVRDGA